MSPQSSRRKRVWRLGYSGEKGDRVREVREDHVREENKIVLFFNGRCLTGVNGKDGQDVNF